jgi:hypothetical protein
MSSLKTLITMSYETYGFRRTSLLGTYRTSGPAARPGRAEVVGPVVVLDSNCRAGVGGVDHGAVADVDPDVGDVGRTGAEEDEISWEQRRVGGQVQALVVLSLRGAGQADVGCGISGGGQAGAVPSAVCLPVPGPLVGDTDLLAGECDGLGGGWPCGLFATGRAEPADRAVCADGCPGDRSDELGCLDFVRGVRAGMAGLLNSLSGLAQRQVLPMVDVEEPVLSVGSAEEEHP